VPDGHRPVSAPLAIFTTCKPFTGKFATLQRNALQSWALIRPRCEILVFGDEPGVAETCRELGLRQIPDVACSEHGTPLMDAMFASAQRETSAPILACVNADIMMTSAIVSATEAARRDYARFLLITRRWNVDLETAWDFESPGWESALVAYARAGTQEPLGGGVDVFAYPRGMWGPLPPYAIGRGRWDSAIIYEARRQAIPVIDASPVVTCLHPNHHYSDQIRSTPAGYVGPDGERNERLLGGAEFIFSSLNATHVLGSSGIRRNFDPHPRRTLRRLAILPALYRPLRPLAPAVRFLAPWWRWLNARQEGPPERQHRGNL
jgi:hypothetical protein